MVDNLRIPKINDKINDNPFIHLRLRFSMLADTARVTNVRIIIIIINVFC